VGWWLIASVACLLTFGLAAAANRSDDPPKFFVVVTGGELLQGVYADSHTVYLARTLSPWGFRCVGSMCIDDQTPDLLAALRFATGRASVVIVTGGLGPTGDDITRETLSEFTGIPLEEEDDLLEPLARRFGVSNDALRENLRRQTRVPRGGSYLLNGNGTAAGLVFSQGPSLLIALPGPPREMRPMVENHLVPYLRDRFGLRSPGASLRLRFAGIGESSIDQALHDRVRLPASVTTSSLFEAGRVDLTLRMPGNTAGDRTQLRQLREEIVEALGKYIYAEGNASLEQVILGSLAERDAGLAIAEVGTHGLLSASLQEKPEAGRVMKGEFVASSAQSLCLLLGEEGDKEIGAETANRHLGDAVHRLGKRTGAEYVVMVGERYRSGDGAMKLPVFWLEPGRPVQTWELSGHGDSAWLVTGILDRMRRELKGEAK